MRKQQGGYPESGNTDPMGPAGLHGLDLISLWLSYLSPVESRGPVCTLVSFTQIDVGKLIPFPPPPAQTFCTSFSRKMP